MLGIYLASVLINSAFMLRASPETIAERGHAVCRGGPYRFVRHRGYVGTLLQAMGAPLLLGSWWVLIPGVTAVSLIIIGRSWRIARCKPS